MFPLLDHKLLEGKNSVFLSLTPVPGTQQAHNNLWNEIKYERWYVEYLFGCQVSIPGK